MTLHIGKTWECDSCHARVCLDIIPEHWVHRSVKVQILSDGMGLKNRTVFEGHLCAGCCMKMENWFATVQIPK